MVKRITYEYIVEDLHSHGLQVLTPKENYENVRTPLILTNGTYKISENYRTYSDKHAEPTWFSKDNPYIIDNINSYLKKHKNDKFTCISSFSDYKTRDSILLFKCNRCGNIIKSSWATESKSFKDKYNSRHGIVCEKCDGVNESLHALALKQIYMHEYPDTTLEDKTCVNPITKAILPTDIVNHRLKVAIEVQGQFHNLDRQKERDKIKKEFWIKQGYTFYDYSIEKISVLDYVKLFFPCFEELPSYVDLGYCNKLNFDLIQDKLNQGIRVVEIARDLNIPPHRIYDAIYDKKLFYPTTYNTKTTKEVVQLTEQGKLVANYTSFREAEAQSGIQAGLISSCIYSKHYYCKGYYWFYKEDYDKGTYHIPQNRTKKFYQKVECYNKKDDKIIRQFDDMYQAANFCDTIAFKVYEVTQGKRKSVKGYSFKICDNKKTVETVIPA